MFWLEDKYEDLFPTVIPRMDGFPISVCMLRTIYSLCKRCGMLQRPSSRGLGGLGTALRRQRGY